MAPARAAPGARRQCVRAAGALRRDGSPGRSAARVAAVLRGGAEGRHARPTNRDGVMTIERKPVAFGDMRGWMKALAAAGEMHEVDAEGDWNIELGTIMRLAQGAGTGPALLFNNIKDYNKSSSRCRRVFGGGLSSYRRVAMMLGLSPDTHPRELVKIGR